MLVSKAARRASVLFLKRLPRLNPFRPLRLLTLPLRLQQHFASATTIARLLDADPRIAFVAYPGLSNHPDHEVATRQFVGRGYGGMLAFALDGDADLHTLALRFHARNTATRCSLARLPTRKSGNDGPCRR